MDMKIGGEGYHDLHPQYLQTGRTEQAQGGSNHEKAAVESGESVPEAAAVYEKGETYDFGTYSVNSVQAALPESALNSKMKTYLRDLGFYDGELGGGYTEEFKTALKCFQKAYFGAMIYLVKDRVVDRLQEKIESVGAAYYTNLTNSKLTDALKKLGFGSNPSTEVKQNFARIQTFFEKGMGCTKYQVAGIMGNIMQECWLDPKRESNKGAFGILQWRDPRKGYLKDFAARNGYSYENIGAQFAYFRYEVSRIWGKGDVDEEAPNSELVKSWKTFKSEYQHDFYSASDFFMDHIEECGDDTKQLRRNYSSIIYQAIS